MLIDTKFQNWVESLSQNYKKAQIKAAIHVNSELIKFYYELGEEIAKTSFKASYGNKFYDLLSAELKKAIPNAKGLNHQNLRYAEKFYTMYKKIFPQVVGELVLVPWGHHRIIIDKCKTIEKCLFYIKTTVKNNLSRYDLESRILANVYERSQNTINNFTKQLSSIDEGIANQIMKDPYEFDFLTIRENYNEKELKDELTKHIESFLLELGNGFAYVGKEVRLILGYTEMYCDLLFYSIKAHCYVVIEIKTGEFKPEHMGQLIGYTAAIDATLKGEYDNKTIGILVCRNKDNTLAQHIINGTNLPVGISEYQLSNLIPDKYKSSLPTIEDLEKGEDK
ncbi:MAG: DUF1016 family protein [Bacilli bacterium]|nr:DUF1016 family protein [Bacilli bacterium]